MPLRDRVMQQHRRSAGCSTETTGVWRTLYKSHLCRRMENNLQESLLSMVYIWTIHTGAASIGIGRTIYRSHFYKSMENALLELVLQKYREYSTGANSRGVGRKIYNLHLYSSIGNTR